MPRHVEEAPNKPPRDRNAPRKKTPRGDHRKDPNHVYKWSEEQRRLHSLKTNRKVNRITYMCPLPMQAFKLDVLSHLDHYLLYYTEKGLDAYTFFATLRRVDKYLFYFVDFGVFDDKGRSVTAWRMYAEECLVRVPTLREVVYLGTEEIKRFPKPDRWCTENTMRRLVDNGMVEFKDGLFRLPNGLGVGVRDHGDLDYGRLYEKWYPGAKSVEIVWPDKTD